MWQYAVSLIFLDVCLEKFPRLGHIYAYEIRGVALRVVAKLNDYDK